MSVEDADHLVDPEAPKPASVDGAAGERGAGYRKRFKDGAPRRKGYGCELIERALPYALHARTGCELVPQVDSR